MKFSKCLKKTVWIVILTLLMCLLISSCGKTPVLYPQESELKVIRENFFRMQRDLPSSRLAIFPSCLVNFETNEWRPESPELMIDVFQDEHGIKTYAVKSDPDVAFQPLGRNQYWFLRDRSWMYAAWVRDTHPVPEGEYAMFTDFICPPDSNCSQVAGVHVYIMNSTGNICIAILSNTHDEIYQKIQPNSLEDCCTMAVKIFLGSFKSDVMEEYPPYWGRVK